jgi:hypothetical protein
VDDVDEDQLRGHEGMGDDQPRDNGVMHDWPPSYGCHDARPASKGATSAAAGGPWSWRAQDHIGN